MSAVASSMSLIANAAPMPQASTPATQADNGFARCLDHARGNDAAPHDEAARCPNTNKPASNSKTDRPAREPGAARAAGTDEAPPKEATEAETQTDANTADTAHDKAAAPDLAALLPGWTPPPPAAAPAAVTSAKASSAQTRDDLGVRSLAPLAVAGTATEANGKSVLSSSTALQAAASEQHSTSPDLQTSPLPTAVPSALVAAATTPSAPKAAEAPTTTAMVPAPIGSPAFAPTLATQVRWWTNDGVQQAQLLLNPAEMGPVTVNILLDGREARIDFSADLAATRGAIEAALPVLAAALDDSGLKLTGGGVHDGSAQHKPHWHAHSVTLRTANAVSAHEGDAARGVRRSDIARGIVDLVA
jgi:flagellar hook-length control protein FliK